MFVGSLVVVIVSGYLLICGLFLDDLFECFYVGFFGVFGVGLLLFVGGLLVCGLGNFVWCLGGSLLVLGLVLWLLVGCG